MSRWLEGAIDLHVHCAPDVRPRKMTGIELARRASAAGMRALLLKNHETSTTALAAAVTEAVGGGITVLGGIVLNEAVGGWNPVAVEMALRGGAKEVWMPTHCAERERAFRGRARTGLTLRDGDGRVREEVRSICGLVARAGVLMGTAHLAPEESEALVGVAREAGVRAIVVTHPEIDFVQMPLAMQQRLAGPDLYFERCYARKGFALDWDGLAAAIRATGVERNVLATDLGQPENPDPVSGLEEMARELAARGFSEGELRTMMCETPARLLGWSER